MACPFCGSNAPLTEEHIWSEWIRKRYAPPGKKPAFSTRSDPQGNREEGWSNRRAFREKTKCACATCNNEWMSRLDTAVIPYLEPLIEDKRAHLDEPAQRTLARWTILKILAGEYRQRPVSRVIPARIYREMYETRDTLELPSGIEVWIARYVGVSLGSIEREMLTAEGDLVTPAGVVRHSTNGYLATFTVNHAMFQVWGMEPFNVVGVHEPELSRSFCGDLAGRMRRIWPFEAAFDWPFGPPIDDRLRGLVARLSNRRP